MMVNNLETSGRNRWKRRRRRRRKRQGERWGAREKYEGRGRVIDEERESKREMRER